VEFFGILSESRLRVLHFKVPIMIEITVPVHMRCAPSPAPPPAGAWPPPPAAARPRASSPAHLPTVTTKAKSINHKRIVITLRRISFSGLRFNVEIKKKEYQYRYISR
jgi:hypothetical protein